ncbi:MAG: signal peptidase II [Sphingomonadales bacterium]|nr:signal peptidase II [Sphingomonadales bacterium]MBD3775131.1 signal peptidase II [Paracoccaceae bacterium]
MNPVMRHRLFGLAIALAIFLVDQLVKRWVTGPLGLERLGDQLYILPFFNFTLTHNYGVSLGMFTADSMEMRWILVGVTGLIALVVTVWMLREKAMGDIVALALILGGALGNIKDRYDLGYVIDYADLHFGDFRPFLVFNIADAAITFGVLIILARSFLLREKKDKKIDDAEVSDVLAEN